MSNSRQNCLGRCRIFIDNNEISHEDLLFISLDHDKFITITNFDKHNDFVRHSKELVIKKFYFHIYPDEVHKDKVVTYKGNILDTNGKDVIKVAFSLLEEKEELCQN
jgi:hypothetical protein